MEIIIGRKGSQKVPITDTSVSREHCKVTDNGDGTYKIENLSQSGTKVDGRDIISATATLNSRIQLGQSFSATLVELIGAPSTSASTAGKSAAGESAASATRESTLSDTLPKVKTFNISHLEPIWENFNRENLEMLARQRQVNLARTGFGILTMCTVPVSILIGSTIAYCLPVLGVLGNVWSFIGMKNAETPEQRQRRQDEFDEAWVCPNPKCGHTLNAKNYKMLVRNFQNCPYCKCKYEVK